MDLNKKSGFFTHPARKILFDRYGDLIILWALGVIWIFLSLVMPDEVGKITRLFADHDQVKWDMVFDSIMVMISAQIALSLMVYFRMRRLDFLKEKTFKSLVLDVFRRILRFNEDFFRKYEIEKINVRIFDDSRIFSDFYCNLMGDISIEITCILIFSLFMLMKSWPLALAVIITSFLLGYVILFDGKIQKTTLEIQENLETARTKANEVLSNVSELRSHTIFDYGESILETVLDKLYKVKIECSRLTALFVSMGPMVRNIQFAGLYSLGAWLCIHSALQYTAHHTIVWGDVIQFAIIAQIFQVRVSRVADFFIQWRLVNQNIMRVKEYLGKPCSFINAMDNPPPLQTGRDIVFENVTFCPVKNIKILDKINLNIEAGKHVAFAGPSGSGKSSLLSLLARDNQPSAGRVKIGENVLDHHDIHSMGKNIGMVYQKPSILNTSIRNNLLLSLRRPQGLLEDREGKIDVEKLNINTMEELNALLVQTIHLVNLEEDIFEKFAGSPLPGEMPSILDYEEKLFSMGPSVIREVSKINKDLIVGFDMNALISGTLFENLLGPGFTVSQDFEAKGMAIYSILENNGLCLLFLRTGYYRLMSEYTIMAGTSLPKELRKTILSTRGHFDEKEELFDCLKSENMEDFPESLKLILFKIALETDIKKALLIMSAFEFKDHLIKSRTVIRDHCSEISLWRQIQNKEYIQRLTVRENLLMGRVNSHIENGMKTVDAVIKEILKNNHLLDEALLVGLEFQAGEGGKFLSGGQKQKISIGRTILKNPDILILDEATANLDETSQGKIVNLIKERFAGKTVITVSHRLSTIKDYDTIFVLEKGHIVEKGDYSSLIAGGGIFHDLIKQEGKGDFPDMTDLVLDVMAKGEITFTSESMASSLLGQCSLFSHINALHLAYLQRIADIRPFGKGEMVYKPEDGDDTLYILLRGEVALFFETGGKREIFQTLTPVDTFGEAELLSGEKRKTGAVASSDSILCALDRSSFLDLLSVDRQVALSFSELISRRLILLQEKLGS